MNSVTRNARDWVTNSTRSNFFDVIQEAKISPRQMQIIEMRFVTGLMNFQIASELNISEKTVEKEISAAYKAVNRVLEKVL